MRAIGIPDRDITVLRGDEGAARLDGRGAANGPIARLRRLVVLHADGPARRTSPRYEQAVRDGGAVLMFRVRGDRRNGPRSGPPGHGGHFINYYGRFATEELERWRGPEPDIAESHAALRPPPTPRR